MSHYSRVKTIIRDQSALVSALYDLGFSKEQIKVHNTPQQLEGYEAKLRKETAEVIIPRRYVGGSSNDIGFVKKKDGTYEALISDYDRSNGSSRKNDRTNKTKGYSGDWLDTLCQRYAYHNIKDQLSAQGLFIESENEEDGVIFLECSGGIFG